MPLYEYQCEKCGQLFEVMQKFSDAPLTIHESCGGPLERLVSAPALQFKGSGWYVTDYAKSGKASTETAAAKSESSTTEKSGDNKSTDKAATAKPAAEAKPASSTASKESS